MTTETRAAGSVGQTDPAAATETLNGDKNSTDFKVKNFTLETNDNNAATAVLLNILIDENKSTQKSIPLLNRNIHELLVFLLKDKKTKDRERRF